MGVVRHGWKVIIMKRILLALFCAVALFFILGFLSTLARKTNEQLADVLIWCAIFAPIILIVIGFIFRKSKAQRLLDKQQKEAQQLLAYQQWESAERHKQAVNAFWNMIDDALADGKLTQVEVDNIVGFANANGVSLNGPGGTLLRKAVYLQTLLNGVPRQAPVAPPAGIAWEPGERFLYAWTSVTISEYQTQKHYVAGTASVSVRVCKGVYVRSGGVRGHVESSKDFVRLGSGAVAVTNRNIYIMAPTEPIKAALKTLATVRTFKNGVVLSFSSRRKMLTLDANDHWFMSNVIMNARHVP